MDFPGFPRIRRDRDPRIAQEWSLLSQPVWIVSRGKSQELGGFPEGALEGPQHGRDRYRLGHV